jgi:hypothetical protein
MLFDLRGRARRRTVRAVYIGLAILFGLGFVGFGVGGGFGGGGIFTSLNSHEGSGGTSYSSQIGKYKKLVALQPGNLAAREKLIDAQLHEAGGEEYVTRAGVTSKGKELFAQVAQSWHSYLALNPPKPNAELAQRMVAVFGEEGLNDPASAVTALQIAVTARPNSASLYAALAQYAYKAKNTRVGDLAAEKAVALAPAAQKPRLKLELAALKKNPTGGETLTATTNGKTYTVNPAGTGSYTGTVPVTPTTTTKKK